MSRARLPIALCLVLLLATALPQAAEAVTVPPGYWATCEHPVHVYNPDGSKRGDYTIMIYETRDPSTGAFIPSSAISRTSINSSLGSLLRQNGWPIINGDGVTADYQPSGGSARWEDRGGPAPNAYCLNTQNGVDSGGGEFFITLPNLPPTADITCPGEVYVEQEFTCTATGSDPEGKPVTYSFSGGRPGSKPNEIIESIWVEGTFTYSVTISDGVSQASDSTQVRVKPQNRKPSVTVSCPATVTAGTAADCTAQGSDPDSGQTLTVSIGARSGKGSSPGPVSATDQFTWAVPGTYTVTASVDDGLGGSASGSASVTVTSPAGGLKVDGSCSPNQVQAGGATTTCSASVPGGSSTYTYSWDNGSSGSSSQYGPWSSAGTVAATVTVTDTKTGLKGGASIPITVTAAAGTLTVSVSCSPSSTPADGTTTATCAASPSGGTAPYTYTWDNGSSGTSSTYGPWSSETTVTATVTAKDSAGRTGVGSGGISVGAPPCEPDPDRRSMSVAFDPLEVRAGAGVTTGVMTTSGDVSSRTATASWGEVKNFARNNGRWEVSFIPPGGLVGEQTITVKATISQEDGCGDTYGPSTFTRNVKITVYNVRPTRPVEQPPPEDSMTVANMPLEEYLKVCLGDMEPWYCGIDGKLAAVYLPELQVRETSYLALMGEAKWRRLVERIDAALTRSGQPPSGLYVPE